MRNCIISFRTVVGIISVVSLFLSAGAQARGFDCDGSLSVRPLSDFLETQGSTADFFPPVPDYAGWASPFPEPFEGCDDIPKDANFALVDYAGLANDWIKENGGRSLRTKVRGRVFECAHDDGTATVTVRLFARRALSFSESLRELCEAGFVFDAAPLNFGNKAVEVAKGAKAALGTATFLIRFPIAAPGVELPDYLTLDLADVELLKFQSLSFGKCADGSPGFLKINQKAEFGEFSEETVDLDCFGDDD